MKRPYVARVNPDLSADWEWFQFQSKLVVEARKHLDSSQQSRAPTARGYEVQFVGLESSELDEFFDSQHRELELLSMLALLSTVEAILRLDFEDRVTRRRKDPVSRTFRELRRRGSRARLDEDVLATWESEARVRVSEFRGALKLRHWLAHGRHWRPNFGRTYDVGDIYQISVELVGSFSSASAAL